ncbi:MAG: hypothetical protein ABIQ64_02065 [Candidatus Saccharimonadales bacterium]
MARQQKRGPKLTQTEVVLWRTGIVFVSLLGAYILWMFLAWFSFVATPARDQYTFATSFSVKQANQLGVSWRDNYIALLDDLEIRQFRLMSYWDDGEPAKDQMTFADLDWQMDEAAKRGAKVSLAIGLRQPRWPECHEPQWATALSPDEWKVELYEYISQTVNRYKNHPALESFQLENEALAWWFGDCREEPDAARINEEFELVKSLTDKPVWMSLSDQYGLSVNKPIPDAYGYSLYLYVYNSVVPGTYVNPSPPVWFHRARAVAIKSMHDKPFYLHELQLEPWGPKEIKQLSEDEQFITMSPEQIHYNLQYARKIGFDQVYTWGSEWWYWRNVNGAPEVWESIRTEINDSRN